MKTRIIIAGLMFLPLFASAIAGYPVLRIPLNHQPGTTIELPIKPEGEIKESFWYLNLPLEKENKKFSVMNLFNISDFIKPEEEINDLNLDTGSIFKELMSERKNMIIPKADHLK